MQPIGYYLNCDVAVCVECYTPDITRKYIEPDWDGKPVPIFSFTESDTPTHCEGCGDVIHHELTPAGYEYVRNAVSENEGAGSVLVLWAEAYGHASYNK